MASIGDRIPQTKEPNVTVAPGARVLTPPARTRPATPAEQEAGTVQVWPHLVVIEPTQHQDPPPDEERPARQRHASVEQPPAGAGLGLRPG